MARKPSPDELRRLKEKATEAAGKGKFDKAAELYREAAEGDPRDVATRQKLAEVLRRAGRFPEAIQAYGDVADRFAKDGLLIKAIAISKTILELDPGHVETQSALAELYARKAQAEGARPPPRTMMVQAMKAVGTPSPPPLRPRETGESVVAIPLAPQAGRPAAPAAAQPAQVPAARVPAPALVTPPESELPPELVPEIVVEPEPTLDAEILEIVPAEPPPRAQLAFEARVPASPAAARSTTAFAQIVHAAETAVASGIEEDLLIEVDPAVGEALDDEPLGAPAADAGVEIVVEPEPPPAPVAALPPPRPAAPARAPVPPPAPARPAAATPPAPGVPRIPIFSDLGREAFLEVLRRTVLHRVPAGQAVIEEGDEGTSFFVVAGGRFLVSKRDEVGGTVVLAKLGDGDFFGEMALLSGAARAATVTAETDAEVLEFRAEELLDVAGRHPHVAQSLRRFYRQRLLANALALSPIFRPFQRGDRKLIMEQFRAREVTEDEVVIREGEPSDGLYVVLEGAVDVVKRKAGKPVVVGHLREGDLFGEMSCLRKAPASATVVVRRPGTLLRLPRPAFDELVVTYPQILELVATLSEERAENLDAILSGHAEWTDEGLVLT